MNFTFLPSDRRQSTDAEQTAAPETQKVGAVHWMLPPLGWVVIILFLRETFFFVRPQFWAEDARVLFLEARQYGVHSLLLPHPAYYIVGPRLVAYLASPFPAVFAPWIYCYAALGYTLLTAWYCLRARLDYLVDRNGKIALALALVLAPQSGEVLMKLIGSQWLLMPILLILILQAPPSRPRQIFADVLGLILAGTTGPYIALFAPWFLLRLRRVTGGWSWYNVLMLALAGSLAIWQLLAIRTGAGPPVPQPLTDPHAWMNQLGLVFPGCLFFGMTAPSAMGRAFYVLSPVLVSLALWALWRGERHRSAAALALFACGAIAYAGGLRTTANVLPYVGPFSGASRYYQPFYVFSMWVAVIYCFDRSRALRMASATALVFMLLSSASHFQEGPLPNLHWTNYTRRLDAGEALFQVPILPNWSVDFPATEAGAHPGNHAPDTGH